jgi:hypothetical protein
MSKRTKSVSKPSATEAVKKIVEDHPGVTTEGIAGIAGIGRSTATKTLARLREAGEVTRFEGGRDGNRRLPDRFTLAGTKLPATYAGHAASGSATKPATKRAGAVTGPAKAAKPTAGKSAKTEPTTLGERLKPGQLDGLVIAYLKKNSKSGPHGPGTIAKALERSSGAVGNCLVRLASTKQVRQVSDKPRRYSLAA